MDDGSLNEKRIDFMHKTISFNDSKKGKETFMGWPAEMMASDDNFIKSPK